MSSVTELAGSGIVESDQDWYQIYPLSSGDTPKIHSTTTIYFPPHTHTVYLVLLAKE